MSSYLCTLYKCMNHAYATDCRSTSSGAYWTTKQWKLANALWITYCVRQINCFLGGFDNIASEHNWMSLVYMFANKIPVTFHLGMCALGCLFMAEEPDIRPVALIWPQSCCKFLLPVFSQSAPSLWISSVRSRASHQ